MLSGDVQYESYRVSVIYRDVSGIYHFLIHFGGGMGSGREVVYKVVYDKFDLSRSYGVWV